MPEQNNSAGRYRIAGWILLTAGMLGFVLRCLLIAQYGSFKLSDLGMLTGAAGSVVVGLHTLRSRG